MKLPDPLVPPDTDVRNLDGFLLNTERLFASELWALSSGDELKAALALWCRAWKQVPAGSLPNDERVLAAFSGAGLNWPNVREMAMRGFIKCSDGRWYHDFLCKDALRAFASQQKHRSKYQADQDRLRKWREGKRQKGEPEIQDETPNETLPETRFNGGFETPHETPNETANKGKGKGKGNKESSNEDSKDIPSGSNPAQRNPSRTDDPDADENFTIFYRSYPRHESKRAAFKAWKAVIKTTDAETIIAAAARYAVTRKGQDPQFTPLPASWLNAGKWEDEAPKPNQQQTLKNYGWPVN